MNDLIPKDWNYEESVEKMKPKIYKLKNLTLEVYYELWTAHEVLSEHGGDRRSINITNVTLKTWSNYCDEIGISRMTAHRWLERYDPDKKKLLEDKVHVSYNAGNNEWYTPQEYIDSAIKVMGNIDVDPASTPEANEIIRADTYYTKEDDGLTEEWTGKVWMNPPYSTGLIEKFSNRLLEQLEKRNVQEAIVLVNNATDTKWLQSMLEYCNAVCFPGGRIHFWSLTRVAAPLQGQVILYFGKNITGFKESFKIHGEVFYKTCN